MKNQIKLLFIALLMTSTAMNAGQVTTGVTLATATRALTAATKVLTKATVEVRKASLQAHQKGLQSGNDPALVAAKQKREQAKKAWEAANALVQRLRQKGPKQTKAEKEIERLEKEIDKASGPNDLHELSFEKAILDNPLLRAEFLGKVQELLETDPSNSILLDLKKMINERDAEEKTVAAAEAWAKAEVKDGVTEGEANVDALRNEVTEALKQLSLAKKQVDFQTQEILARNSSYSNASLISAIETRNRAEDAVTDARTLYRKAEKEADSYGLTASLKYIYHTISDIYSFFSKFLTKKVTPKEEAKARLAAARDIQIAQTDATEDGVRKAAQETARLQAEVEKTADALSVARKATQQARDRLNLLKQLKGEIPDAEILQSEGQVEAREAAEETAQREHKAAQEALEKHEEAVAEGEDGGEGGDGFGE